MDYHFSAIPTNTHLHAIGSGTHTSENLRRFINDVHAVVSARPCNAVLLESRFSGPSLDLGSLYSIIQDNRNDAILMRRIAYVDIATEHLPERAEFAELAANKLGLNARMFRSVVDAEQWLQSDCSPHSPPSGT